jgi:hypothetical protein
LEAVLKSLFVFVVVIGGILHDDGVVAFTDFAALLHLPLHRDLDSARWRLRLGDEPLHIILRKDTRCQQLYYKYSLLDEGVQLLTSLGGRTAEYSSTGHAVYGGMSLKILVNLSTMSLSSNSPPRHPRRVVVAGVLEAQRIPRHQRLDPALHETEGHVLGPQSSFSEHSNAC